MNTIQGGTKRPYQRKSPPTPKYDPKDEAEIVVTKKPPARVQESSTGVPTRIAVKSSPVLRSIVPGNVWRQGAFKWDPQTFVPESEKLNERFIQPETQDSSLTSFCEDVMEPVVYCVAGNPDDTKAKYFAAWLVAQHLEKLGNKANAVWHVLYGGFDNPLLREFDPIDGKASPTLLVLSNLTPTSSNTKLEKARDLIERFADIPRVIVCAGEDPLSFMTTRLYAPINALAYFSESLIRKRVEVI